MAKKGQKFRRYSENEKQKLIELYQTGVPATVIQKEYGVPKGTIHSWQHKVDHPKEGTGIGRGKYKRPITVEDYKERYEILKKY